MNELAEGMQANDLDFLIMPILSIDEYESKIDDRRAVVLGFYVTDADPAAELSAFIEKGTIPVLDTEVSPAPTEDGYYLVFVEMDRNEKLPKSIIELVDAVNKLTNVSKWQFSPYHSNEDENYPLTVEMISDHVNLDPESIEIRDEEDDEEEELSESIVGFMRGSLLDGFAIDGNLLTIQSGPVERSYDILQNGHGEPDIALIIDESCVSSSNRLQALLGGDYQVYATRDGMLVLGENQYLLLREID